jgi:hypothetical protein
LAKKLAGLKYSEETYTVKNLKNGSLTPQEMIKEYNRLRKIANARLERMKNSEYSDSQVLGYNYGMYTTVGKMLGGKKAKDVTESEISSSELPYKLEKLSRFITAKRGTLTGQREIRRQAVETLHDRGYEFVTEKNYNQFVEFLNDFKNLLGDRFYDSDTVIELWEHSSTVRNITAAELLGISEAELAKYYTKNSKQSHFQSVFEYWTNKQEREIHGKKETFHNWDYLDQAAREGYSSK